MKSKTGQLLGILAATSMLGMSLPEPRRSRSTAKRTGHTSWGLFHDAKTNRSRAKERRAKTARKLNWN